MAKKGSERSQLLDLFLHVAAELGYTSDRDIAELAGVSIDNIANWRGGAVKELKTQTLRAIKKSLSTRFQVLHEQLHLGDSALELGLIPLEVEEGSGPTAIQRQFVDRMIYDYLGHRFLYFEPQGALAWENLIKAGYAQDSLLATARELARSFFATSRDGTGRAKGTLAREPHLDRKGTARGLDIISLGPGEGGKEALTLEEALRAEKDADQGLGWLTLQLVDVSIPLLLTATKAAKQIAAGVEGRARPSVTGFCADFEEGPLSFAQRLPTATPEGAGGLRLVMVLGNIFGNVRDEETFLRQKILQLVRPGDLLWLDVGVRLANIEDDPLYKMTDPNHEPTAAFTNRRLLLEGPYRRWEAAIGRPPSELETRVWVRERDETCRVPGSLNYCHDLIIKNERRVCTMLYSRRYDPDDLSAWLERYGFSVERIAHAEDSSGVKRAVHLLLQRRR